MAAETELENRQKFSFRSTFSGRLFRASESPAFLPVASAFEVTPDRMSQCNVTPYSSYRNFGFLP